MSSFEENVLKEGLEEETELEEDDFRHGRVSSWVKKVRKSIIKKLTPECDDGKKRKRGALAENFTKEREFMFENIHENLLQSSRR